MEQYSLIPVLSVAGSDSCGGAGIQADIKTISALGAYAMTAITAITAQNTLGVRAVEPVGPEMVAAQIDAVFGDAPLRPRAVKIGMLHDAPTVRTVAAALRRHNAPNIVLDPVLVATSGAELYDGLSVLTDALTSDLFPISVLVTPNVHEARVLTGCGDIDSQLRALHNMGCRNVLLKGGDRDTGATKSDCLSLGGGSRRLTVTHPAIDSPNTHGTGCTLSSAIAAWLARGIETEEAVRRAIAYVQGAIEASAHLRTGEGHGSLNHFYKFFKY